MATPPSPVCNFICGSDTTNFTTGYCLEACEFVKNCALTPNILYTFVNGVVSDRHLFTTGVGGLVKDRATSLAFRLAIYQQVPWFVSFVIIIIVLIMADIIAPLTGVIFLIIALLLIVLFIYLSASDTSESVALTTLEVRDRLIADYINARPQLSEDLLQPLAEALAASQVPCGPAVQPLVT